MIIAYLRGKNREYSISFQQEYIIDYALKKAIAIDMTEIDDDSFSTVLEQRSTMLKLLRSLNKGDQVLIYDLWVFSKKVGELTKVFDCILKNSLTVRVCAQDIVIDQNTPLRVMVNILSNQREQNLQAQNKTMGRPKGSFSKSKFDKYKTEVLQMLEQGLSVSEIAKRLGVSRSSLKDYINSRSLKEIIDSKNIPKITQNSPAAGNSLSVNEECDLKNKKSI